MEAKSARVLKSGVLLFIASSILSLDTVYRDDCIEKIIEFSIKDKFFILN